MHKTNMKTNNPLSFPRESSELETKPNRTFNLYPNVIVKQRYTALKSSNAKETITHLIVMQLKNKETLF